MKWKSNGNLLKRFGLTAGMLETKTFSGGGNKSKKILRLHVATGLTRFTLRQLFFLPTHF